ncbi:efflux RND transporter periplasmic adaptor subunit [Aliivibrio fischeri]|uniref:Efflux RND transporter periplasmic adaptor subunit n=2 Tax=Aliivibrio fischeri TaxID=668 RepID=A0A1E5ANN6_ALIFS|nr:efflux RND transporter periplasmic adaptor subunit [Aliivibrio fischeri]EHN70017.1 periplasmic component of efflux system [Aliivibrio fischeri SR5]MCE7537868.1 efflux RND transporter periplasmic adaptor subunit [Aliivibrio fischeri]MCE7557154.1 efflux RND transporter periplasmic adaptor subunit [Aliivibrio fischeri]MCE7560765.1 efflux RND transporter periplasmic adaptor subunit [Aliivibrio fischeri]MCE7564430.1 efflux RND transporter periplasmic adaptor subunit [Aliivibrio fischeri]
MNKTKSIALVVLLACTLSTPSYAKKTRGNQSVAVLSEEVATHEISQSLSLIGKLKASESVVISPEVAGKIERIAVKANQNVRKGQLVVQLNDDKAIAAIKEARAYLNDEKRKLTEFQRLAKKNAITQTEIDGQKASVDIAQARLDAANADLSDLHISAPFAGTVGFIDFSRGKMVSAGTELLTLDNLSVMQLDLQVPERYLSMLSVGMNVEATSQAWENSVFSGKLIGVDSRINAETLNLRVRIEFPNKDLKMKPGMLMAATLDFPAINAPIIPVQALEYSGTKRYVYVIGEDNKAIRTEVTLGARVENRVVIASGLNVGDEIVVQGLVNMRDGVTVKQLEQNKTEVQ